MDNQNIRVNVHFMQHNDGSGNLEAFSDGHSCNPDTANSGYAYTQALIEAANTQMAKTPITKCIRWILDGVFFDRNTVNRQGPRVNTSPIIVGPYSLPYTNTWQRQPAREQLDALFSFQANKLYQVKLTTYNGFGVPTVRVKYISTTCLAESIQGGGTSTTKTSSTLSATSHD